MAALFPPRPSSPIDETVRKLEHLAVNAHAGGHLDDGDLYEAKGALRQYAQIMRAARPGKRRMAEAMGDEEVAREDGT